MAFDAHPRDIKIFRIVIFYKSAFSKKNFINYLKTI